MELIDIIIYFIRMFVSNMCVYYCFSKITNTNNNFVKNNIKLIFINILLLTIYVPIKLSVNSFWPFIILAFIYSAILARITNTKWSSSIFLTIISFALAFVAQGISVFIQFIPYKLIYKIFVIESRVFSLIIISFFQIVLLYGFFKIKRFSKGFSFLNNKLDSEATDIIVINVCTIMILVYCLTGTYYDQITWSLIIAFIILCITMFFTIKKMITMYYKQKLLKDTMDAFKLELEAKQAEIDKLNLERENVSKITHEFYNRQKALELLVASNFNVDNVDKEGVSQNVLNIIESLTSEYSSRFESVKDLPKLDKTDIPEIDNMFTYMQSECSKSGIEFKLKIDGNIHSLVNNIIPKNRLETLIGDHLRDGINAVNLADGANKEILVLLGMKNKKYELAIYDTGLEFEIDTLLKLGLEKVTTNKERGGTGTGFMTTFETLAKTKASLIITEYPVSENNHYTKCVSIRFDGKNEYKICSYRAKEIKKLDEDKRIKIVEYK